MKSQLKLISVIIFLLTTNLLQAQVKWTFEISGGIQMNVPLPLIIRQSTYPDIRIRSAKFDAESFKTPFFNVWRFSRWNKNRAWEFEGIHQKLFLSNKTPEIQNFSISHGLNIQTINRAWKLNNGFIPRIGVGVAVTHPESTIRNKEFNEHQGFLKLGYYISGPTLNLGIAKRCTITKNFFLSCEAKTTATYARVPVFNGKADVYNIAFQFTLGLGVNFANSLETEM
ncbi:hypothetical protein ACFLQ5_01260 [Bacteroidota bacterium]